MDDDLPLRGGAGASFGAASQLAGESLDSYSQDELDARIALLETEIARIRAHRDKAAAHRLAAEAFFRPSSSGQASSGASSSGQASGTTGS